MVSVKKALAVPRRYVAIGDSATEGLEDPDPQGGYRGWADRLAMILSQAAMTEDTVRDQPGEAVRYANLGIRGHVSAEVRALQFDRAMAMRPDLMTITAGVNDCLALATDFEAIADNLTTMLSEASGAGITVMMFTLPDPVAINPLAGRLLRDRILRVNQIQRIECERYGALLLDLERFPVASDPRLWYDDRLHGNALGHEKVAHGMAWLLGIPGHDDWADPLPDEVSPLHLRQRLTGDIDWARHHLGPWLVKGLRGIRQGEGVVAKRPELTPVVVDDAGQPENKP